MSYLASLRHKILLMWHIRILQQKMPFAIDHSCTVIIGPEGGFIPYEVDLLIKTAAKQ
jgi:16S rRNA U1498 N3-methylase RsmE